MDTEKTESLEPVKVDDLLLTKRLEETMQKVLSIDLSASESKIADDARRDADSRVKRNVLRLHHDAPRYANCKLSTFNVTNERQRSVRAELVAICERMPDFVSERKQLFLWGSVGTGKDHLMVAVLRVAAQSGYSVRWAEGLQIYESIAAAFSEETTHSSIYRKLAEPDVLCISDPVFEENWSDAKAEALRKTVRRRYNLGRPTWITCNLASLEQADEMFGEDTFDRLQENGVFIECRWETERKRAK